MPKNSSKKKSMQKKDNTIDCGDLLDISMVNEIYQKLNKSLDAGGEISVNLSKVQRVDAAGAQMLCAFFQDTKSKNIKCVWKEPSEDFLKSIQQLGLNDHLGISTQ